MPNKALYATAAVSALAAFALVHFSGMDVHAQGPVNTSDAVEAANWADNVTITISEARDSFRFESDGIPSHGFAEKYLIPSDPSDQPFADKPAEFFSVVSSDAYFSETPIDTTITTLPTYVEDVTDTTLGRIGVAITGRRSSTITKTRAATSWRRTIRPFTTMWRFWTSVTAIRWWMAPTITTTAFRSASRPSWIRRARIRK